MLQRNCGSGLNAIVMAAQAVTCGEGEVFVAGGVESMSRAPYVMNKAETAFGRDGRIFDSTIGARFPNPRIEREFGADTMPETADNLARDYQITREACDVFAAGSQRKYAAGKADGFFTGEIFAVEVPGGRDWAGQDRRGRASATADRSRRTRPAAAVAGGWGDDGRQRLGHQ